MSALRTRKGTDSAPGPLEVRRISDDRVGIRSNDEPTAEAIVRWLAAQGVVVKVRWHKNTGAIDVRYR